MQRYSNTPVSDSNVQDSPLTGFKFSTIGQAPSLLERMNVDPSGPFQPSSDQTPPQEQNNTSHIRPRSNLSQSLIVGFERGRLKPFDSTSKLSPSEPLSNVKHSRPPDEIRASAVPDLRYPNEIESSVWESRAVHPQPVFVDQDAPHTSQAPVSRNLLPVSAASAPRFETSNGTSDNPTVSLPSASSQHNGATSATEPEQVRRALEYLFGLASDRDERMAKQREIFDLRSSELSTSGVEALRTIQELQDKTGFLKQQAEEMRAQAEQALQEAGKMRDMADRLIASAGTLGADTLGAKDLVGREVERVEQLAHLVRNSFNTLTALRVPEKEQIALVEAEITAQDHAERIRRQQELQQQLERRKIEEQEKEAAKRAEEELARKKAEANEAARKRLFEMRRAEVMADKRRAAEAQEIEKRIAHAPPSGVESSVRGSNAPPGISPGLIPETTHRAEGSTVTFAPQVAVPGPSQSPGTRTGGVAEINPPLTHPPPSLNKVKAAPIPVSFVPAQTEAGRAVNTDSPLSSTTLASELHGRNVVEAPKKSHLTRATHNLAKEQTMSEGLRRSAPTSESHPVQVKREPFVEEPSVARLQPLPDLGDTVQSQRHQQAASVRTTSQDMNIDQHVPASSTAGSRATSMHVVQADDHHRRSDPSERVPLQDDQRRTQDPSHDYVVPSTDGRAYRRQDSVSSDLSASRWDHRGRRSPSPVSSRGHMSRSRSNSPSPYLRKRMRSRTPPRYEPRHGGDYWVPGPPRVRPRFEDRDRSWRPRKAPDTYHRNRPSPPRRAPAYRSSRSPPPSPRQFRNERSPPRRSYRDRPEYDSQRFANVDSGKRVTEEHWTSVNAQHYDPPYEDAHRAIDEEEEPTWQQRLIPNSSERDQTSTPSLRQRDIEIGLLERINMNEADDRGRGRGRPPAGPPRGGPTTRRGMRGASSSRGRSSVPGSAPVLLSRMTESTQHPTRTVPAASLSDRLQQD